MAHDFRLYGGLLSALPTLGNREPGYVTDQPRLYVGNTGLGNTLLSCLKKINGTAAPTVNDDAGDGYSVGSVWCDTTGDAAYVCVDSTVGGAVWIAVGSGNIQTLLDGISTTTGALLTYEAGDWVAINPSTAGYVLTSNGVGNASTYQAIPSQPVTDGDYGDITVSVLGSVWTIDNGVVTEAKQVLADNTTCNVSITAHGYAPKAPNDAKKFLDGTGAWDTVKDSDLSLSDITTNNATSFMHGFCPKLSNVLANRLNGQGGWTTVTDTELSVSDVTTNNASTSAHGFLKKLDNVATHYMDGQGNWSVVPAASDTASGIIEVATAAETTTGTDTGRTVVPGRMQYHPSATKAFVRWDSSSTTPTIITSYNVTSLTDMGVGDVKINLTNAFSSATAYAWSGCQAQVSTAAGGFSFAPYTDAPTASVFRVLTTTVGLAASDVAYASIGFWGTLA